MVRLLLSVSLFGAVVTMIALGYRFLQQPDVLQNVEEVANSAQHLSTATTTESWVQATEVGTSAKKEPSEAHPGMKLYRNEEFGFEFWYPGGWRIEESKKINPHTEFVVASFPVNQDGTYPNFNPLEVMVTTVEHMRRVLDAIESRDTATQVTVAGISVFKHEYIGETFYTTIMIPLDQYVLFISNYNKEHVPEFNRIVSTFKFTR